MSWVLRILALAGVCFLSACSVLEAFDPGGQAKDIREIRYVGVEIPVYVTPKLPTQINFPSAIRSHLYDSNALTKTPNGRFLTLFSWGDLPLEGEKIEVQCEDRRRYRLWVVPAYSKQGDVIVNIIDRRSASDAYRAERDRWR